MNSVRKTAILKGLGLLALLFLSMCGEFKRDNPFDPELNRLPDSVTLVFPPNHHVFKGTSNSITLSWNIMDDIPSRVRYSVYLDQSNPPDSLWASNLSVPAFTLSKKLPMGRYYWKIVAEDVSGTVESPIFELWNRMLFVNYPPFGTRVSIPATQVNGYIISNNNLKEVSVNGWPANLVGGSWSKLVNLSNNGNNWILIQAKDIQGIEDTLNLLVIYDPQSIDSLPPEIKINSHTDLDSVAQSQINLDGEVYGGRTVVSLTVNSTNASVTDNFNWTAEGINLPIEGFNTINFSAVNDLGKKGTKTMTLIRNSSMKDTVAPYLLITNPDRESTVVANPLVNLSGQANDKISGVRRLNVGMGTGGSGQDFTISGLYWQKNIDLSQVLGFTQRVIVLAEDNAGNTTFDTIYIKYDTDAPDLTPPLVELTFPPQYTRVGSATLSISGTADDDHAVASVKVISSADGQSRTATLTSRGTSLTLKDWSAVIPVTPIHNTLTTIEVMATDTIGRIGRDTSYLVFDQGVNDQAGPEIIFDFPGDNELVSEMNIHLVFKINDLSSVIKAEIQLNGSGYSILPPTNPPTNSIYEGDYDLKLGDNTIEIKSSDGLDNLSIETFHVIYDPTSKDFVQPEVALIFPPTGQTVMDSLVDVKIEVKDLSYVDTVLINDGMAPYTGANDFYERKNIKLKEGSNPIRVRAVDKSRNHNVKDTTFNLNYNPYALDILAPIVVLLNSQSGDTVNSENIVLGFSITDETGIVEIDINGIIRKGLNVKDTIIYQNITLGKGRNVITVNALDLAHHDTTLALIFYYYLPPNSAKAIAPLSGATRQPLVVKLKWSASHPDGLPLTYELRLNKGINPPTSIVPMGIVDTFFNTSLWKPQLDQGAVYYWQVIAYDTNGLSSASDVFNFKTDNQPTAVKLLFPTNGQEVSGKKVNLSWSAAMDPDPGDTIVYDLYCCIPSLDGVLPILDSNLTVNQHTVYGLGSDIEQYDWQVIARDLAGLTDQGATSYFTVNAPPQIPSRGSPNTKIRETSNVTLSWSSSDLDNDPLSYDIYMRDLSNPLYYAKGLNLTTNSHLITVIPGTKNLWYVNAKDGLDTSSNSDSQWILDVNKKPFPPQNISPNRGAYFDSTVAYTVLYWQGSDADDSALSYLVYVSINDNVFADSELFVVVSDTTYRYAFYLNDGNEFPVVNTYYWKVMATDGLDTTSGVEWDFKRMSRTGGPH